MPAIPGEIRVVTVNGYPLDVVRMETFNFETEVTSDPVEGGVKISDHAQNNQPSIELECVVSDTPIGEIADDSTRTGLSEGVLPSDDIYNRLMELRKSHALVPVQTTLGLFENMMITRVTVPRSAENTGGLTFSVSLVQLSIAEVQRTQVKVATPLCAGEVDFGLSADKLIAGNHILWRKGKPPGTSPATEPKGVIVGQEVVYVVKGNYFHSDKKKKLTTQENIDFTKDLNRDVALMTRRKLLFADIVMNDINSKFDKVDAYNKARDKNPGQYIDPALFGLKRSGN